MCMLVRAENINAGKALLTKCKLYCNENCLPLHISDVNPSRHFIEFSLPHAHCFIFSIPDESSPLPTLLTESSLSQPNLFTFKPNKPTQEVIYRAS